MSELINNLQQIYNAKLAIKSAIGTQSDELADYAGYITALKPNGYTYLTENGSYNISAYEYAYVNVSSSIPEGYVLPTGTITCDSNGVNYDVKQYAYAYINVEGGGQTIDSWNDYTSIYDMIMNELTEADYVGSTIISDFTYGYNTAQWTETVTINTEDKNVRINLTEVADQGVIGQSLEDYPDLYDHIYPIIQNATLSVATGDDAEDGFDYILDGELYAWNLNDMSGYVEEITENGFYPLADTGALGFNINIEGGGSEPESYTLEGGLFINGQGQYYVADEGDLADYINIIPKEDVTGSWSDKFSYLTVGKNTEITGYNYYNGGAMAIQAESYTQSSSIAYQTARLANIEPYLDKEYYGLGQYYDSAYITVNRSFNYPNGTQLGIPREVYGYYFPNSSYTNRYKDLMVDVSYIVPAGDDILGLCATAMAFGNTTYALDLQNIRYCDDFMVYDNTYVTATTGIADGITYYEIDLTQSGNYGDSDLDYSSILSGGAFFADMPNLDGDPDPIVYKLEVPGGTFKYNDSNDDWILDNGGGEGDKIEGYVVFNKDHTNNPALQIDTGGSWIMDEFGNWNPTGIGTLTVNGINSLKIRFYKQSNNLWMYNWLIDVDYEFTPDEGGEEEPEPEE